MKNKDNRQVGLRGVLTEMKILAQRSRFYRYLFIIGLYDRQTDSICFSVSFFLFLNSRILTNQFNQIYADFALSWFDLHPHPHLHSRPHPHRARYASSPLLGRQSLLLLFLLLLPPPRQPA